MRQLNSFQKAYAVLVKENRCRAKFMTCEIHDHCGSAHAHMMRMTAFASYISQRDNNTRASAFGYGLASEIETNSSADIT